MHDFLLDLRGAERVFLELCRMFPDADVFTAVYDEQGTEGRFADRRIRTSSCSGCARTPAPLVLFPLYPRAIESFDFSGYDLVISSSSASAHGVVYSLPTLHVGYCHNPFVTRGTTATTVRVGATRWPGASCATRSRAGANTTRRRARQPLHRHSKVTEERLRAYFERDSNIVYPPVDGPFRARPGRNHYRPSPS